MNEGQLLKAVLHYVVLEHFWFVVLVVLLRSITTVAAWTSWASVIAAWASVIITTWTAIVATVVIAAWATLRTWTALWLYIALRLLEESLA